MVVKGMRIKLNRAGIRELLTSEKVASDLQRRAEKIASAAGGAEVGFEAVKTGGPARARSIVITTTHEAKNREARDRTLTRAIDAGR